MPGTGNLSKPAIAQLVEHLTVECCSNQMVPGSIPGGRIYLFNVDRRVHGWLEFSGVNKTWRYMRE